MAHHRPLRTILFRLVLLPTFILGSVSGFIPANAPVPIISRVLSPLAAQPAIAQTTSCGTGDPLVVTGACSVTIDARDFASGLALDNFNYIINVDNTKLPNAQNPNDPNDPSSQNKELNSESFSPIVRTGGDGRPTVTLPDGRYLVSVRSLDHKMWGAYFTLPDDATDNALTVPVALTEQSADHPLPLGRLITYVFNDNAWTNGAPDAEESVENGGTAMAGFRVELTEQTDSAVTVDYFNNPLCGDGVCLTDGEGFNTIENLGPATYNIDVHPPDGPCNSNPDSQWYQTTTIDGGLSLLAPVEEGSDGSGAPGEQLWEPIGVDGRTGYFFGFVCVPLDWPTTGPYANGNGEIVGQARNWVEWAPYTVGTYNDPVENPFIALTDAATDETVFVGQGDAAGNFDIQSVPAGTYNMAIWDEQLTYIMRFKPVTVAANQTVDVNETSDDPLGPSGVGVSRWFGWLDGYVYKDVDGNGQYDPGIDTTLGNTDVDQRWRDGSIKEGTFTDPDGYYVYPTAEGGALGRWIIGEQGFAHFSAFPGASVHDEHTGLVTPSCVVEPPNTPADPCIPNAEGGGLLVNQLVLEGHRATVDWGKRDYPDGTPGQIVGITYFATTRNEFHAALQAHEDYEPAIPDVIVYLEGFGPDGLPNTDDDVIVNAYVTDHWQQPNASQDPLDPNNSFTQNCDPIRDYSGAPIINTFDPYIGPNCLEVPLTGLQTKEGKFDGGYAFADYCPPAGDGSSNWNIVTDECAVSMEDLVAGDYIVHVIMPTDPTDTRLCNPVNANGYQNISEPHGSIPGGGQGCIYRVVKEEDVNVDLGNNFAPQIPPPPCVGDDHVLDQSTLVMRSPYYGDPTAHALLCDKHLVVLQNGQNANADFNMMTNFPTDPNGDGTSSATGDVAEPARFVGQVFNDIYFETNPMSPWYGEPRPIGGIPVGIYARVDTVCPDGGTTSCGTPNVNLPYDPNKWRLLTTVTTSLDGSFEALVPSNETWNCPIPQGPCPGMYLITVDDPGQFIKVDGTVSVSGNTVTGTGTRFFQIMVGDRVRVGTETRVVTAITSNTSLTVDSAWGAGATGTTLTIDRANPNFDPNLLIATTPADAWPGLTDPNLDLPLDPISGTGCDFSIPGNIATTVPELLQVSRPYVNASDTGTARQITIYGDFIGPAGPANATGGRVTLTDDATGAVTTLTQGNGIVSWTPGNLSVPDTIVIQVPAVSASFLPGPKQLHIVGANSNGGNSTVNGITLHVLYTSSTVGARTDMGTTRTSTFVTDSAIVAGDLGRTVTAILQTGLTGGRTIVAPVTPGVGFTINAPATATGTRILTITKVDSPVTTNGTTTVADTAITAADNGRTVFLSGVLFPRTITGVTPGVSFTVSGGAIASGTRTATIVKTDTGAFITTGTLVLDPSITAADVGQPVSGAGVPAGTTIVSVTPGVSFVMSNAATATSYPGTVPLTIGTPIAVTPYNPPVVNVLPPPPAGTGVIQTAINSAAPGSLIVLSPGVYNENLLMWKPVKLQGVGPGGIIGAHELQQRAPEDPRFSVKGSIIDGRFFQQNFTDYDALVTLHAPYAVDPTFSTILRGADITVVAQGASAYGPSTGPANVLADTTARLDGLGLQAGHGDGAGGIQLQANINNMQITNNILENNGGLFAGGIGLGQPYAHANNNYNVRIANDRLLGNGGLARAGGLGIFYGSNNYEVARSILCSNFGVEYGAGLSHWGLSPNGSIHDNQIYYNDAVDSGAGIAIQSEVPVGRDCTSGSATVATCLGDGSGTVNVDRNLIQSNYSGDDGGGIFVANALTQRINIRNNMIVDNGAADLGGAILLDDASNVAIINNTVANNVTTASSENSDLIHPHAAGLASEANEPLFASGFSNPVALFNNIFWNNEAFLLDQFGPAATLISQGFIDFEVNGSSLPATSTFTPRFSDLTNGLILGPDGVQRPVPGGQANLIGADPLFVAPFILELTVSGSRGDPQQAAVNITGQDPPVGLAGDYHITAASPVIDRGAGFSNLSAIPPLTQTPNGGSILAPCSGTLAQSFPADYDRQFRPQLRVNLRVRTPWDLGADELPGTGAPAPRILAIPGSYTQGPDATFTWNTAAPFLCSDSTVP